MTRFLALLAVLAFLAPATASADPPQRIVGGQPASAGEYPFYALLQVEYGPTTAARCGAALIAARYLVTAGHCLDLNGASPTAITAWIGDTDRSDGTPPEQTYDVLDYERHPDYVEYANGALSSDVAVLLLERPAPDAQLRLPRPSDAGLFPPGTTAMGIGFGKTESAAFSNQLLEVPLAIVPDPSCTNIYGPPFNAGLMLCAGIEAGRDTCQGDSGGPLVAPDGPTRFVLAGVVSFGPTCGSGTPAVYADSVNDPLNNFIRGLMPQVEIELSPAEPEPGQQATLTAKTSNPNGPYGTLEWDLDNDGAFDDGTGVTAQRTFAAGISTVGVRAHRDGATDQQDDNEIRYVNLDVRFRSPVAFATPAVTVTEGDAAALTVTRQSGLGGTGGVTLVPVAGSTTISPFAATPLSFAAGQASQTVSVPTLEDFLDEPDQTFRVDLAEHSGDLLPGAPGQATVTVVDDDPPPSVKLAGKASQKVKRNTVTIEVPVTGTGTLVVSLANSRGRLFGRSAKVTIAAPGLQKVKVKLNAAGRKALKKARKKKGIKVKVLAAFTVTGSPTPLAARRNLTLKR